MARLLDWDNAPKTYNARVVQEANEAAGWLNREYTSLNIHSHDDLKNSVRRAIDTLHDQKLSFALYMLAYQEGLQEPGVISFVDVENALWLMQNPDYGIPEKPATPSVEKYNPSWFRKP
ncbi:hypothetical protein [Leclercia sp. UBA7405]|uniref:hypothetical protein n=1 Tax=Leclercia sp. UBA7405 TaxID=1946743 RepID=UPI001BA698D2|nr:hypothetical protein [Enterobacter sp. JGM127]